MFLKKNIIQHQQNIEKLIIDYKLLKKAMNFLYKKIIISLRKQRKVKYRYLKKYYTPKLMAVDRDN